MKNKYWKLFFSLFIFHHLSFIVVPDSLQAQQTNWLWAHSGGGKGADQTSSIAIDSAGNVYGVGYYADSAIFSGISVHGEKGNHFFLAKYAKNGSLLWIKSTGLVTGQSQGNGITVGKDNYLYVTGYFSDSLTLNNTVLTSSGSDDIFLAKYDFDGNIQWVVRGGGPGYNLSRSVSTDRVSGNIYITGSFSGSAHFGSKDITSFGGDDIFLIAYDSSGSVLWAKNFGSKIGDVGYGITTGNLGNIAVTGTFGDTADFGGKKLIAKGKSDIFIAKYTSAGDLLWAEQAADTSYGQGASVVMDSKENVYVTGRFYFDGSGIVPDCDGTGNIYIAKYNSDGVKQWMKCAGNGGEESGDAIALDSSGYIYVTGGFDFRIDFGSGQIQNLGLIDAYIAKFNSSGIAQWSDRIGGDGDDEGTSVAIDPLGNILFAGGFSDTCAFGSFTLLSQHLKDAFVTKIGPEAFVKEISSTNSRISIYPNPAQSAITIEYVNDKKNDDVTVEIVNPLGVVFRKNIFRSLDATTFPLSINDLPKGIYFCHVSMNSWSESRMVVVQ
jgi:hypothetical protein